MNLEGFMHLTALVFLSGVICLAISLNENRGRREIARKAAALWGKFLGLTLVLAAVVQALSCR
jgi:hypothetical protein